MNLYVLCAVALAVSGWFTAQSAGKAQLLSAKGRNELLTHVLLMAASLAMVLAAVYFAHLAGQAPG